MTAILKNAFDAVFGCRHSHLSRPFTLQRKTYEVCLDCGREIPYSLTSMSKVKVGRVSGKVSVAVTAKAGAL